MDNGRSDATTQTLACAKSIEKFARIIQFKRMHQKMHDIHKDIINVFDLLDDTYQWKLYFDNLGIPYDFDDPSKIRDTAWTQLCLRHSRSLDEIKSTTKKPSNPSNMTRSMWLIPG